jgi:hypothetical protein
MLLLLLIMHCVLLHVLCCRVIPLCLRHRLRKDPMADIDNGDRVRQVFKQIFAME